MVTPERGWAQRETDGWVASGSPLPEAAWNNLKTGDAAEMQAERRKRNLMPRGPDFLCWEMRLLTAGGWLGSELQAPGPWAPCLKTCAQIYSPAARLLCARGARLCSPLTSPFLTHRQGRDPDSFAFLSAPCCQQISVKTQPSNILCQSV